MRRDKIVFLQLKLSNSILSIFKHSEHTAQQYLSQTIVQEITSNKCKLADRERLVFSILQCCFIEVGRKSISQIYYKGMKFIIVIVLQLLILRNNTIFYVILFLEYLTFITTFCRHLNWITVNRWKKKEFKLMTSL